MTPIRNSRPSEEAVFAIGCLFWIVVLAVNALLLAGGVWLVVTVLQWMGVL